MAAQMNYSFSTPAGIAGGLYDLSQHDIVTRMNEAEDGKMGFGIAVVQGTNKGQSVALPASASVKADFEGIVVHAANTEQDMTGKVIVKKDVSLSIIQKGKVWGKTATGCTAEYGKTAYVVVNGDEVGYFTDSADGTVDIGAKFGVASDSDAGIAVIEIK